MDLRGFGRALIRRKKLDFSNVGRTELQRCLNTFDLTALGIGSTLGLGIYVLAGEVAARTAGPAVVLSFLFAAVASVFAGLCYAEFGARVPRAGSAYIYSYVTVGEFIAFVIGWNLVLEYVIGTASVARGYSGYIDSMLNKTIQNHLRQWMPMDVPSLSEYPDIFAFGLTLMLTIMLALGVKESTRFNTIFTGINLLVVLYVVVCGAIKADLSNWNLKPDSLSVPVKSTNKIGPGKGGFFPFGFSGMMKGAATCFYGFIGFDVIATTGEEVRNPRKAIPFSIVVSLAFIFLAYFGVSSVQTLMWPYYDQDPSAPLPYVFEMVGWPIAKWVISIGAVAGLSTSLLGAMFPLPRVLYAMATDGLIFRSLANVHPRFKTPLLATIISGVFAGGMAAIFNIKELADMMSIGTLLAYTLVAVSVLILRFSDETHLNTGNGTVPAAGESELLTNGEPHNIEFKDDLANGETDAVIDNEKVLKVKRESQSTFFRSLLNLDNEVLPTPQTSFIALFLIIFTCGMAIVLDTLLIVFENDLFELDVVSLVLVTISILIIVLTLITLNRQPRSARLVSFEVPWVPALPVLSIVINFYLMLNLSIMTWIRFAVWMAIGLSIYAFYGIWNSNERRNRAALDFQTIRYDPQNTEVTLNSKILKEEA